MPPKSAACPVAILLIVLSSGAANAQGVGINATGAAADTSALLDLSSTSKGLLPPRMSSVQRSAIVLPATGLVVYQSDGLQGLYWNAGTPAAPSWKQVGEAGAGGTSQWVTNGANISYSLGNVGIQRTVPLARLDVLGGNWDVVNGEGDVRIGDGTTRLKIGIATGGGGTGAATIMEQGPAGAYNVLSLGTQGNKVLHVNGATQRVGIGTDAPNAALGFPPVLGKKITLYPGPTGDVGIGVGGNRLQLYADNPNADVAMGYDQAGVFTERFAVKPTGALAVNGDVGAAGQVLQSNGGGAAATWVSPTSAAYNNVYSLSAATQTTVPSGSWGALPDMFQSFSTTGNAHVIVSFTVFAQDPYCALCGGSTSQVAIDLDGARRHRFHRAMVNGEWSTIDATMSFDVGAGSHTVSLEALAIGKNVIFGATTAEFGNTLVVQVIPQ
jgi:hypothetical protein